MLPNQWHKDANVGKNECLHFPGQSLLQGLTIEPDPQVVARCDRNNQTTVHIKDPDNGIHHPFTSQEDALMWLEKGRFM